MAQAEPFEPDLGHASEGTGRHFRQFCAIACSHFIQHARISLVSGGPVILPAFTQGIYGRLRQQAGADWQHYVAHPFLRQLADGTLPESAFRRYLTQDYLFLIHFARSYALLVSKLRTLAEMRVAAASMKCWSASV